MFTRRIATKNPGKNLGFVPRATAFAACFFAMACLNPSVRAEVVVANLDFNVGFSTDTQVGAAAIGSAGDVWNKSGTFFGFLGTETGFFAGNTGGGSQGAFELLNTAGGLSGVSYQMTFVNDGFGFNGAFDNLPAVSGSSAANLMRDYAYVGGADAGESMNFLLSGLNTNTNYSLYVYGNGDALGQGATWTLGSTSQTTAFDGTSTLDIGAEYAKFTFNTGLSTTQAFAATQLGGAIAVNGFQLAEVTAVPEPSSIALAALIGAATVIRQNRKRRNAVRDL